MNDQQIIQLYKSKEKLLPNADDIANFKYASLWTKAAMYYFRGADEYKRGDYFGYPKKNWSRKALKDAAGQIANEMRGISSENPIVVKSLIHAFQVLYLFHFEIDWFEMIDFEARIIKVKASHMIDHENVTVYFKIE